MEILYNECQLENHQEQALYYICIDAKCKINEKLLCCFCKNDHSGHRHTAVSRFLREYEQQYVKNLKEEEESLSLNKTYAKIELEILKAKEQICTRFDQLLGFLKQAQTFKDPSYEEIGKILRNIGTSENMAELIGTLAKQIESLQPSGGNSFILKRPLRKLIDMNQMNKESERILNDYIEFKECLSKFENQIRHLQDQIQKLCDSDQKQQPKQLMRQTFQLKQEEQLEFENAYIKKRELQNAGQEIFKALFIDDENVLLVFYDGKGHHENLKLKNIRHFNTELGSSINDVTYSEFTKYLCFGTKQGQLYIFECNLSNQAERLLILKNSIKLETNSILFVLASNQDDLAYTLNVTNNLKVVNTLEQNLTTKGKYTIPQLLKNPLTIIRYMEKKQVLVCGTNGLYAIQTEENTRKFSNFGDRSEKATAYFLQTPFLYIICQKFVLTMLVDSFQTYNKCYFYNTICMSIFIPAADILMFNFKLSNNQYQTIMLIMQDGVGIQRQVMKDYNNQWRIASCPQLIPHVFLGNISGQYDIVELHRQK